jgi:hypothetical protein
MAMMTRVVLSGSLVVLILSVAGIGHAGEIGDVAWTESNLDVLRTFDKAAIEDFANDMRDDGMHAAVGEFAWIDLAGDKQYELVTRQDLSGRAYFDYLVVYRRNASGKITRDWIEGCDVPALDKIVRDLDGDGKDELIVPSSIDRHDPRGFAWGPSRVWPKVYELRSGRYVDGSRKFAKFYDEEVLRELDAKIDDARDAIARDPEAQTPQRQLAVAESVKQKVLRVLGRRPEG